MLKKSVKKRNFKIRPTKWVKQGFFKKIVKIRVFLLYLKKVHFLGPFFQFGENQAKKIISKKRF